MVSKAGKLLLKNTIQSLEHKNKVKEEKEMWKKWMNDRHNGSDGKRKERYFEDNCDEEKHKSVAKRQKPNEDLKTSNYWLKKLMAEEEKRSNERWTHNGFKELYSEELLSDKSSSEEEEVIKDKKKCKKKKKKHKKKHKKHKNRHKE